MSTSGKFTLGASSPTDPLDLAPECQVQVWGARSPPRNVDITSYGLMRLSLAGKK